MLNPFLQYLADGNVLAPELDASEIGVLAERYTGAALLFAKRITHYRDGLHRSLEGLILGLHGNDAPGSSVFASGAASLVLLVDLVAGVEDEVEVLCGLEVGKVFSTDVAVKNRELAVSTADV